MPNLRVYNHQDVVRLSAGLCRRLESCGLLALSEVLTLTQKNSSVLQDLDEIEVSLLDDEMIADVHLRFMSIPGPTDVITFDHGEIHIGVETAVIQAGEYGNDVERELMLYIVHGLLHLAGYDDGTEKEEAIMDELQQSILSKVW